MDKNLQEETTDLFVCLTSKKEEQIKNCKNNEPEKLANSINSNFIKVLSIDKGNKIIEKILEKKFIKSDTLDIKYTGLYKQVRANFYNSIFYLNEKENEKGLKYIKNNYLVGKKLLDGDIALIGLLVGNQITNISLLELDFIINSYNLTKEDKDSLIIILKEDLDMKSYRKNAFLGEYKNISSIISIAPFKEGIFYDKIKTNELIKNIFYTYGEENYSDEGYICGNGDKKYFESKIKYSNILKKNFIGNWLAFNSCSSVYFAQNKKLEDTEKLRKEILEKLRK